MALALRTYWRSSCSWRVRIALHHKGLAFESIPVHLLQGGGQQFTPEHRAANPMSQVPVLLVDGEPLAQSMAILEYLEEVHPEPTLLPGTALDRARARQLAEVVNSGIQPIQNLGVMLHLRDEHGMEKPETVRFSAHWIRRGFVALEAMVRRFGGQYCVGDEVSVADLCLVPQLYNARRFKVDLAPFPSLTAVEQRLEQLPAFQAAHPSAQPDAQPG